MRSGKHGPTVREAVGVFNEPEQLKQALDALHAAGFPGEEIGLLASEHAVTQSLGEFYAATNAARDSGQEPAAAFVRRDGTGDTGATHAGGLFFIGTAGGAGAVVASSAVLGGALLAAVSGVLAVGAVGALVATIIHQSDADYLQQQVDEGRLLLFVRVPDAAREKKAKDVLARHAETAVKVIEVPARRDASARSA